MAIDARIHVLRVEVQQATMATRVAFGRRLSDHRGICLHVVDD